MVVTLDQVRCLIAVAEHLDSDAPPSGSSGTANLGP